ncbi:hypothetical protein INS49_015762 [Diaporthe citri]|uniref:uncharacterized protein n=1 Tax=Diaporthe citri TaxID=83186 RepID=UPI001C81C030|nr:uncharacterized protein INS49_015762 [Diaporthe citri]KAG6356374.1 hypothetical protein INS49_015762 [Diaporthe citri]
MSAVVALVVIFAGAYVAYQLFLSPLSRIPGPFWAKLSYFGMLLGALGNDAHRDFLSLHKKYGKVVRIGPNSLSVTDPAAFREIYKAGGERDEKVHGEQRKLVARAYSMESMIHLEPRVDETLTTLLQKFDELQGQTIDLAQWLQLFAFDIIGAISFSRPYGYVEAGDDNGIFALLKTTFKSLAWLTRALWFFRLHQRLKSFFGDFISLGASNRNGYFHQFAWKEINARKAREGDDRDMLGKLLTVQQSKPQMNDTNIAFMMTSNVTAGSDTTSFGLSAIFHYLLNNPDKYRCLVEELEKQKANERYFFTFGGGSRTCIGRNISWLEMEKLVPTLLMRYNFQLAPDAKLVDDCGFLMFARGLYVNWTLRDI